MSEPGKKKKKKGTAPSKEEAAAAFDFIKNKEQQTDEDILKQEAKRREEAEKKRLAEIERAKIQLAQDMIRRKLREKLKQKELQIKQEQLKSFLESGNKVKWKSLDGGNTLKGYYQNKLLFEIKRGLSLFSLYIKDQTLIETKKLKSYQGCSMTLQKLKAKSEKLI